MAISYPSAMKIMSTALVAVFAAPLLSLALPVLASSGGMVGGCHGHRDRLPVQDHACCYATPTPVRVQMAPHLETQASVVETVAPSNIHRTDSADADFRFSDVSHPLQQVLRI